ncbi:MAG: capsular biosynthesis protein [Thermoflexibacter sp.]|jgi:tyrosine-protein phosphatase YwqE|nr:capsular biosynthesis protein [Thermoflexibacter sp.]
MLFLFKKKKNFQEYTSTLQVDMHSHLLPAIDDGAKDFENSISLIKSFVEMGYKKLITTPHIMSDFYKNTPEVILDKLDKLNDIVKNLQINIDISAAAEYYLDEGLVEKLEKKEPLLSFGKEKYLLFETSYMNASPHFDYAVFLMQSQGYRPVLAHPERYVYLFDSLEKPKKWYDKGVLLQININSLNGYYSTSAKYLAEKLIDNKMVNFLGSDCHNERHIQHIKNTYNQSYYQKALKLDLLNYSLA